MSKPLAYITRQVNFCGSNLYIDERVYVPNPETQELFNIVETYIRSNRLFEGNFIDVGTGSGNLAISIAKKFPRSRVIGTDISSDALEVAHINLTRNCTTNLELIHTDLVQKVSQSPDLIICNLPWGATEYMLDSNSGTLLSYMPKIALFPQNGVIGSYLNLCKQAIEKEWETVIFAEIGKLPKSIVQKEIPEEYHWEYIRITPNYSILKITI